MGFDFTVAVIPSGPNMTKELQYVKSALLYADKVRLVSPIAYLYLQFTDESNQANEKNALHLLKQLLPMIKSSDSAYYHQIIPTVNEFTRILNSKQYRSVPYSQRLVIKNQMRDFARQVSAGLLDKIGSQQCSELRTLIDNKQVIIEDFINSPGDIDACVSEYFRKLKSATKSSYPLFDEQSNDLMRVAIKEQIVYLSDIEKRKITHAGLADNYIQRLPSFEVATIDEIIDIKKELSNPVVRFRSSMLTYSESIQALPWDQDFAPECTILFDREIAPALLEIEEATKANSFIKNLGNKFFTDEGAWKTTGGLVLSVAAAGVLPSFTSVAAANASAIVAGGAIATTKIAQAYSEYSQKKKEIQQKDLFFYYQAGKMLNK